jgi:mRNA interferase MazF
VDVVTQKPGAQGEVWLATLDPTVGSEQRKTRPCVVVSPDEMNRHLNTVILAPLTTGNRPAPYRIEVDFLGKPGRVLLDHIRSVDRLRLVKKRGHLDNASMAEILKTLREMFRD